MKNSFKSVLLYLKVTASILFHIVLLHFFWKLPKYAKELLLIHVFLFWKLQLKARIFTCLRSSKRIKNMQNG